MRVPYIRFWLNDFYDATDQLEFDVQNTYHAMLDKACMTGHGSLPNNDRAIRLLLGISAKKWGKRRALVMPFWSLGADGRLHNKRLDEEWAKIKTRFVDKSKKNGAVLDASRENMPGEVAIKERGPLRRPKGNQTTINSPAITTRARAQATDAEEDLYPFRIERSSDEAQTPSKPPASLSVGHATRAAPNSDPEPPTTQPAPNGNGADPMTRSYISENGAARFLVLNSPEWIAYQRDTGRILNPLSSLHGDPGAWVPIASAQPYPPKVARQDGDRHKQRR